jgi:hypothetical protein
MAEPEAAAPRADEAHEALVDRARELLAPEEAEPEAPSSPPEAAAEPPQEAAQEEDEETPEELPEHIRQLLEDDDEPVMEAIETVEDDEFAYEEQEDEDKLRRELDKTRKQLEHEKGLRLKSARPKWEKEAGKFFPHSSVDVDQFESRRAFLRAASADHERIKIRLEPVLQAERMKLDEERARIREEEKAKLEAAWGRPTVDTTPSAAVERERRIQRASERGSLADQIKAKYFPTE